MQKLNSFNCRKTNYRTEEKDSGNKYNDIYFSMRYND